MQIKQSDILDQNVIEVLKNTEIVKKLFKEYMLHNAS